MRLWGGGQARAVTARAGSRLRSGSDAEFDIVLDGVRKGARWACSRIYESLAPPVAGYLRAQGADDPDDLVSEVFLRVFAGTQSFSGDQAQFRAWVFTIAHSRLIDARRAKNRAPELDVLETERLDAEGPTVAGAEEQAMDRLAVIEVHQLLRLLTADQRDVLALRLIGGMSVVEVAMALDKPPGAVKALQRRALAALRRRLGPGAVVQ